MKFLLSTPTRCIAMPLAVVLAAVSTSAQVIQIVPLQLTPAVPAAEAAEPAEEPFAPIEEAEPVAPDQPVDPLVQLAEALKTMKFDRSGEALLAATRAQRGDSLPTPAEEFSMSVMLGDWQAVAKSLASLPPEDATIGYTRLLDSLAGQSISVDAVLKTPQQDTGDEDPQLRAKRLEKEREEMKRKPAPLLSEDFYALVNACPGNLREENIEALAKLAKTALGEGGRSSLVARMSEEWKGLGGATPEGHKLAARLLSSLGWIRDAAPFLPLAPEQWDEADTTQLVFTMEYFTQVGIADRDERQLQMAADISARLMRKARFGNYTRPQFRLAMDRLVQLLPELEPDQAIKLIREQLFSQSATLSDLIGIIGELGQTAAKGTDTQARAASLATQHLVLNSLVEKSDEISPNSAVLVMNWLNEAEACYRAGGVVTGDLTQAEQLMMRRYGIGNGLEQAPSLSIDQILNTAPPSELMSRLNPGLAQRVQLTRIKVSILQPDVSDLQLLRDYVKLYPGLEREVCQDVLAGWVSKRTKPAESEQVKQMRAYGMYVPPQLLQLGSGIPLTRLRQNQNIAQFKNLLTELRTISPQPLDPTLIVQAFMTLHSGAEVYRMEDIESIFGPPENMVRKELLDLLGGMRERLNQEWRDPQTQQQAATNRTEQEAQDEVSRGYRTALELATRGIHAEDSDWDAFITRGQLFYDASQFELERQVQLTDYVSLRDEAFSSFAKATEIYAQTLPSLPHGQWTISPYQAWFFVMLGASDLAQLTSNTARTDPGLRSIGEAMRALPNDAGGKHLEMFANMLAEVFPRVPANVRQQFLGSGLVIVGENNPAAAAATKSLDYYKELIDEIQLKVTVDGSGRIGHSQSFGAFITLETTRQLLRESGGFSKYLQNQPNQQALMYSGGAPTDSSNLRDDFTKNIHAALDETFEVISITFHDSAVKTIDLPRDGWVETPLAYLVLRAKNAAVDRIPSIQMDMDFVDQPGQVKLPVMSAVEPVDAKESAPDPRPCANLALTLTMDQREWKDGKIIVEIHAKGQGVIPPLDQLFDTNRGGFKLETVDGNLSVSQFVSDGKQRLPEADRNWQLTYQRNPKLKGDVTFPFPKLRNHITPASIDYKHYQDADLITVPPAQAVAGIKLAGSLGNGIWKWLLAGLLTAASLAAMVHFRRSKSTQPESTNALAAPTEPTPFNTIAFLRRIRSNYADHLSDPEKTALDQQIIEIEAGCFSRQPATPIDLSALIHNWTHITRRIAPSASS